MSFPKSCKAGDAQTEPAAVEMSADFAKGRKWARDLAHKVTTRSDGYRRWEFHDGSVLTLWPDGRMETR